MRKVKIALLGCGNVGKYLVKNIFELKDLIRLKYGIDLEIVKILVRDKKKPRTVDWIQNSAGTFHCAFF
jgi:Homoserine dehydrogenase